MTKAETEKTSRDPSKLIHWIKGGPFRIPHDGQWYGRLYLGDTNYAVLKHGAVHPGHHASSTDPRPTMVEITVYFRKDEHVITLRHSVCPLDDMAIFTLQEIKEFPMVIEEAKEYMEDTLLSNALIKSQEPAIDE